MLSAPDLTLRQDQEMDNTEDNFQPQTTSRMVNLTHQVHKTSRFPFALGSCADLYKGLWMLHNGETLTVAIKAIRWGISKTSAVPSEELYKNLIREAAIWLKLDHPNITPFFGVHLDLDIPTSMSIILPYYEYGNIMQYVQQRPTINRIRLVRQITAGLSYLHSIPLVHEDVRSTNVLINGKGEACLVDFGLSHILECSGFTSADRGSLRWMAPELAKALLADEDPRATTKSDVWSFAMTVLEVLTSRLPFHDTKQDAALIQIITAGVLPSHEDYPEVSDDVWDILLRCWQVEPTRRPSVHDTF